MKRTLSSALVASAFAGRRPRKPRRSDGVIKIGVLNDRRGLYADLTGEGSVVAAQHGGEDFGASQGHEGRVVSADHQNKPDVASTIARQWYDRTAST
jgi:branched-chain amino acid transport system substrate-binding protein